MADRWPYRLEIVNQVSKAKIRLFPPGPALHIKVSFQGSHTTIPAKLDTGSDFTTIPHYSALSLKLIKFDEQPIGGALGGSEVRPVFKADLEFMGFSILNHPLISLEKKEYMLIGRDILNEYITLLHGRDLQFTVE